MQNASRTLQRKRCHGAAERCSPAAERNTTIKWESCTGRTLYFPPHNNTQKSIGKVRAKWQNTAVHWQNVVALAAEQNSTIKWESVGARVECCSANDAMEDWQNVVALPQNKTQQSNGKARDWQNVVALLINTLSNATLPLPC
jgi:hypothetical protein